MKLERHTGLMSKFKCVDTLVPIRFFQDSAIAIERDKNILQGLAVVAAAIGDSATASSALHNSDGGVRVVKKVEFEMDSHIFRGFLEACPFGPSDEVSVIAKWRKYEDFYEVKAIARPLDRLIALQPDCTCGRDAYCLRALKRWGFVSLVLSVIIGWIAFDVKDYWYYQILPLLGYFAIAATVYALIEWRLYVENFKQQVHMTEEILGLLGVSNPKDSDLIKISKSTRTGKEPMGYLSRFYRY